VFNILNVPSGTPPAFIMGELVRIMAENDLSVISHDDLSIPFRNLNSTEGWKTAEAYNGACPLQLIVSHSPLSHIAESRECAAGQERQHDQKNQQSSSHALNCHACPTLDPAHSTPGNTLLLVPIPSKSALRAFFMPMYHNPALSQDHIGMVMVLGLLLSLVHLWRVTWGSVPLGLAFGFTQKAAEEFWSFLFVRFRAGL